MSIICVCAPFTSLPLMQCVLMGEHLSLKIASPFDLQDGFVITSCIMCCNAPIDDDVSAVVGRRKGLENGAPVTCSKIKTPFLWTVTTEAIREMYCQTGTQYFW